MLLIVHIYLISANNRSPSRKTMKEEQKAKTAQRGTQRHPEQHKKASYKI
jgi:hypothetical protein